MSPEQQAFLVLLDLAVECGWPNGPHGSSVLLHVIGLETQHHPDAERLLADAGLEWVPDNRGRRWIRLNPWSREYWEWLVRTSAARHRQVYQPRQLSLLAPSVTATD